MELFIHKNQDFSTRREEGRMEAIEAREEDKTNGWSGQCKVDRLGGPAD